MEQRSNGGNGGPALGPAACVLMLDQVLGICTQAREAIRDHPRACLPITSTAFAQIEWLGKSQGFIAAAPTYGMTAQEAARLTELPAPTAQQRQRAEQFEREIQQHA